MIETLYRYFLTCTGVSTDTRTIREGDLFFALKGPSFDGNRFARQALEAGAKYAVVDDEEYAKDEACILVDDVLGALQALARYHRGQFDIPVFGLTGSNGKTTTKELISRVLSKKYRVLSTKGNLNNHIGVPLTLLGLTKKTEIAVVEMGANHVGEIAVLCEIADPTHGMITNIGKAHLEGFGGFEGVIRGKSELYHYLIQKNGVVFINSEDKILNNMGHRVGQPVYYPGEGDYYHANFMGSDPFVELETAHGTQLKTHLMGGFHFFNIAAALCIGKYFGVDEASANQAVEDYKPENNRSQLLQKGSNAILLDAYNANPDSMQAALKNFESMKSGFKVVILGDMNELGEASVSEHQKIGELTHNEAFNMVLFCGEQMQYAAEKNDRSHYFTDRDALAAFLAAQQIEDAFFLIKGSRGMKLEEVVDFI